MNRSVLFISLLFCTSRSKLSYACMQNLFWWPGIPCMTFSTHFRGKNATSSFYGKTKSDIFMSSPDLRLLYKCLEKSLLVFPNKPEVVGLCFCSTGILTLEEPPWSPKHNFNCLWTVSTNINVYSGSRSKTTDNKDPWLWNCLNLLQALVISEDSFYLVMPGN